MRALAVLGLLLVTAVATSFAAPPGPPATRAFTLHAVAFSCPEADDGVCLGYAGAVPGPFLDVNLGDTVVVTLVNDIATTLPPGAPSHLATSAISFHVHGMAIANAMDGIPAHAGTQIPDSTVAPGASRAYTMRAVYPGVWHYHDHVLGADGQEGVERGLYGTIVVRSGAEPRPANALDLHMLDSGANGGRGLDAALPIAPFEVAATGMGNLIWTITMTGPGGFAQTIEVAPGTSERILVATPLAGVYPWTASDSYGLESDSGTVTLQ
jgi:FtsP/CotA-like multicopper oxidase with cupredoxin domain